MGLCISGCVQMLTRLHDERTIRKEATTRTQDGEIQQLAPAEKQPSVLLVFSVVERQTSESKIISFLRKVFKRDPGLIRQRNPRGETLLYFTCKLGKVKVIEYLLEQSDNVDEVCSKGSAIHACVCAMHQGILTSGSSCDIISRLLEKECDVDAQNSNGWTAFFLATNLGCLDAMRLLVERGCDVNAGSSDGLSALHVAVANGHLHAVHFLLGLPEVNPNALDGQRRTPLNLGLQSMLRGEWHEVTDREFESRAAIVERLLIAWPDTNIESKESPRFTNRLCADYTIFSSLHNCRRPLSTALCVYIILMEEIKDTVKQEKQYILQQQWIHHNTDIQTLQDIHTLRPTEIRPTSTSLDQLRPLPISTNLDHLDRMAGVMLVLLEQLVLYGARVPDGTPDHLVALLPGYGVESSGSGLRNTSREEEEEEGAVGGVDSVRARLRQDARVVMRYADIRTTPMRDTNHQGNVVLGDDDEARTLDDVTLTESLQRCTNPLNLQTMCRTSIRVYTAMGSEGIKGLQSLPLPAGLIKLLCFYQD